MGCAVLVVFDIRFGIENKIKKSKKHRLAVLENKLFLKIRFWKLYYTAHKKVCQISLIIVFIFIFIFFSKAGTKHSLHVRLWNNIKVGQ